MSFTNGEPWVATEQDCQMNWSCGPKGKYFRCAFCGHRFVPGDRVRWQYTNDTSGAGGNPLICANCDEQFGQSKERICNYIKSVREEFKTKYWWFLRNCEPS